MAQETEIKLRISDTRALLRQLKKLGARPVGGGTGRVHQENVIFDTPQGGLAKHGQLLRIRTETPGSKRIKNSPPLKRKFVLTFKHPIEKPFESGPQDSSKAIHKVREELELEITDAAALSKIFQGLGMSGWFRYEKYRTTLRLPASQNWARGLLIELDETPIGAFVELEGPAEAIDRAAGQLGFSKRDYILKNYLVLYIEDCRKKGEEPRHMVFPEKKKHSNPSSQPK
ncbi:MAG TPA: class IV adenylate cyclase [Candidatus Udaeobacter sp.]|nr:class IV adenylate cyclase [Candidatus Udaeobacter sp.]